jgi:hypothetical protein
MTEKQYLKMADVFRNEMRVVGDSSNMIADDVGIIIGCYSGDKMAEYVLHAINSHDELVAENELLREVLEAAKAVVTRWNTPNCKDAESTAAAIGRLMAIISKCSCSA